MPLASSAPPARSVRAVKPVQAHALLLAATVAAACQSDAGSSPALFDGDPWVLSGPQSKIGSLHDDPDYIFGPVTGLVAGPDGLLYTLHRGEATVRRWTADGQPAGVVGRGGEGPGEFARPPRSIGFFGDSLWVWDWKLFRVSYFDLAGEFLGSLSPKVDLGTMENSPPRPETPLRDGTFLGEVMAWDDGVTRGTITEAPYVHMDAAGETLARIWTRPYEQRDVFALLRPTGGSYSRQPFGDDYLPTVDEGGLVVLERRAWTGEGEAVFTVTKIDLTGDTVFTARVPYAPVPLPAERIDSAVFALTEVWYEFMSQRQPGLARAALERRVRDGVYKPAHLPPVSEVLLDRDRNIWLRRFDPVEFDTGEAFDEWWIMDPDGAPMARALTPAGLRIMSVADDLVWGTEQDELDVDYIVRYRLVKAG